MNIYGNLEAVAQASTEGTSEAIIEVDALVNGDIDLHGFTAHAKADQAEVLGDKSAEDPVDYESGDGFNHARIIIHVPELEAYDNDCLDNHMGLIIVKDAPGDSVLFDDFDPEGDLLTAEQYIDAWYIEAGKRWDLYLRAGCRLCWN
ncbi:hypothetical protein ES705_47810 [subsurface metagenome]